MKSKKSENEKIVGKNTCQNALEFLNTLREKYKTDCASFIKKTDDKECQWLQEMMDDAQDKVNACESSKIQSVRKP